MIENRIKHKTNKRQRARACISGWRRIIFSVQCAYARKMMRAGDIYEYIHRKEWCEGILVEIETFFIRKELASMMRFRRMYSRRRVGICKH